MKIFSDIAISQLPRLLGFMDRDPRSATYGCCDRSYWHYKVSDFPNSRLQEVALVMALALRWRHPDNRFFNSATLREWVLAAINFWAERRHHDGSTDESYPYERHFCSTAFGLYSMTEALILIGEKPSRDLSNTGQFLIRNSIPDVANQMACAAEALLNLFSLTGEEQFRAGAEDKLTRLFRMQSAEGHFSEYGGFDLGYDSITLSFLAGIFIKTGRRDVERAALACIGRMRHHINENGYFSPDEMSRKTQFLYPYGLAVFAPDILNRLERGLEKGFILNPAWMDDRYCAPFTADYLKAASKVSK
jgi:hypothetical protein